MGFRCLISVLRNLSAEMCAGSLVSGCWFSGPCFEIAVISGAGAVIFGAQNYHLAGLVAPFWQPGDHFGTLWEPWEAIGAAERTSWDPLSVSY